MVTLIELVLSLAVILLAALFFTNAVEILGERLDLARSAVGSLLAAVGTALPETMIPIVAILGAVVMGRDPQTSGEIGIGAILGAPFLLATLAMFVVGISALGFRSRRESGATVTMNRETVRRDLAFFLVFFGVAAGTGLVPLPLYLKIAVAIAMVVAYAIYVWRTLVAGGEEQKDVPSNLRLWPFESEAPAWAAAAQLLAALAVMFTGAHFFVEGVKHASESVGIPAGLIALVLAPLATELPEKFNSVIWLREDKDTLAFGNITGAMVFQSTIPVSLGILFTAWRLNFLNSLAAILALASGALLFLLVLRKAPVNSWYLLIGGAMYAAFALVAVYRIALS